MGARAGPASATLFLTGSSRTGGTRGVSDNHGMCRPVSWCGSSRKRTVPKDKMMIRIVSRRFMVFYFWLFINPYYNRLPNFALLIVPCCEKIARLVKR